MNGNDKLITVEYIILLKGVLRMPDEKAKKETEDIETAKKETEKLEKEIVEGLK